MSDSLIILYVEDDVDTRELYSKILARQFGPVITAENGDDGIAQFVEYNPQIVITDIRMPNSNGIELVKSIKHISPQTPIIVLSAYSNETFLINAVADLVVDVLPKPTPRIKLIQAVEDVLTGVNTGAFSNSYEASSSTSIYAKDLLATGNKVNKTNKNKAKRTNLLLDDKSHAKSDSQSNQPPNTEATQEENNQDFNSKTSLTVVAIGASAGGLEALTIFLHGLPENANIAYVIA